MKQDHTPQEPMDHPESRRSVPPPPPSRRGSVSPAKDDAFTPAPESQERPTAPSLTHTPPSLTHTAPSLTHTAPSHTHTPLPPRPVSSIPTGPLKPRLGSTPIAELNRARDPVRALHERELEHLREQHQQALAEALLEKDANFASQALAHQTHMQALLLEQQAQLQALRAESEANLVSMRRRVAVAAHLALEDRQGLLRHLEDENDRLRSQVHELEAKLDLPATVFPDRPRTPSLPPEMFIPPSLPAPAPTATAPQSAPQRGVNGNHSVSATDDLTRLRGVGPAIARGLVQLGVTKFSQIASWTDADIERIAPRLRTRPNRIRKDGWIKSAQRLENEV